VAGPLGAPKKFVQLCSHHGGVWGANMFPADGTLTENMSHGGHAVRSGALRLGPQGALVGASPVLSASASRLTAARLAKMNVLRGLDIPFYIGHHTGGHLGNYARNDGNGQDGKNVQAFPRRTIDQIMAWSPSFYSDLGGVKERSMVIGNRLSYDHSNPQSRSGPIQEVAGTNNSLDLFRRIFVPQENPATVRAPIVDRVLADYKRLRESNLRLSAEDRRRLDDHMQRMSELERRLTAKVSCNITQLPSESSDAVFRQPRYEVDPALHARAYQLFNDVIVAAFSCGTSRVAVMNVVSTFSSYAGDWHQEIAHQAHLPAGAQQRTLTEAHRRMFDEVFLDLVIKLDGAGILDDCLVVWTQESGNYTHDGISIPVVTAGGAGGALNTGRYADFRNLSKVMNNGGFQGSVEKSHAGLLWHQWLGTALQAMGVPKSEYEADGVGGYPSIRYSSASFTGMTPEQAYPSSVWSSATEMLPFVRKT
jgi:hypothetical protein